MLYRFKRIISKKVKNFISNQISKINADIISTNFLIFDDIFPHPLSDWRQNEFLYYLKNIRETKIITGIHNSSLFKETKQHIEEFKLSNPFFKYSVTIFNEHDKYTAKLGYCLFYNNLKKVFPIFIENKIPFVFTLYPGGGFKMYDYDTDKNLSTYFSSSLFRHVIVNMPHVYDYIIQRFNIDISKVSLIYGAPLSLPEVIDSATHDDSIIRIVFSSHKYVQHGVDKGFDIFNKVAKYFEGNPNFEFTCIGGFSEKDLITSTKNINFISDVLPQKLSGEFAKYDIIISPNRSHVLHYGAFDGFPTGSVLHACNSGCMMMLTDDWNNATRLGLVDNESFIFIAANSEFVVNKLLELSKGKSRIKSIAYKGKGTLIKQLDLTNQMKKRITILKDNLK
jgi:hypothetical protein